MNPRALLDYELYASYWWVSWISNEWLQEKAAKYFAWKVNRKYAAYQRGLERKELIERRARFFGKI
jgi:hypothetical protein